MESSAPASTPVDRLSSLLLNATAKQAQAVWREANQLGIGEQVRRAWLDKMGKKTIDTGDDCRHNGFTDWQSGQPGRDKMNYAFKKALCGAIKLYPVDDQGCIPFGANVIATFSSDDEGQKAFELYRLALFERGGSTLINADTGRYEVGNLAQVLAGIAA